MTAQSSTQVGAGPSDRQPAPVEAVCTTTPTYVREFARFFNAQTTHTLTTTSLKTGQLTATHLSASVHGLGMSAPMPEEDAYVLALQLGHSGRAELWKRGRKVPTEAYSPGSIAVSHLSEQPVANLPDPFECILFHMPQPVLDELSTQSQISRPADLSEVNHAIDPVLHYLGLALVPAMADPQLAGSLFFDHIAQAINTRLVTAYGRAPEGVSTRGRRLSRVQAKLAKELLVADLCIEPRLCDVAQVCGLPVRQFVDAFHNTFGVPPFRWLRAYRIERAKYLLRHTQLSLAAVGQDCGFSDQSHFTRSFLASTGTTPGVWRRTCGI